MRRVSVCLCLAVALAVAALLPVRTTRAATIRFAVTPNPARADQPVTIWLTGLAPGQRTFLDAQFVDVTGAQWEADATFRADARGVVDPATQAPLAGTYNGVRSMGLLWSAAVTGVTGVTGATLRATEALTLTASVGGQTVARAATMRDVVAPDVTAIAVRTGGLYGVLYRPAGHVPAPGVLVLGGSEGGVSSYALREAALLADHGYAALAL